MNNTQKNTSKNIWSRGMNKIYSSLIQPLKEREFISSESQTLRYMFFPEKKSKILLVDFYWFQQGWICGFEFWIEI